MQACGCLLPVRLYAVRMKAPEQRICVRAVQAPHQLTTRCGGAVGVVQVDERVMVELEDVASGYRRPSIVDIKVRLPDASSWSRVADGQLGHGSGAP